MKPYYNFTKRPSKTTQHQSIVRKLDEVFSHYIRLRDADESGNVVCVTCFEQHHWTEMQCGHYVLRSNMGTRWHLQNCNPQCSLCNSTSNGKENEHEWYIDNKYGIGTAEKLRKLGKEDTKFTDHELQGMYDELKKEVKALKQEKGFI